MELAILLETLVKTPNRSKTLDGSGVVLGETQTPTTRIGAVKEIELNLHALVSLPGTMTLWTFP